MAILTDQTPAASPDVDDSLVLHIVDPKYTVSNPAGDSFKITLSQIKDFVQLGLYDDRGNFDASVNAYPSSGGSGAAGAILKSDIWTVSVAGTLPTGIEVQIGDTVRALLDGATNVAADWAIIQANVAFDIAATYTADGIPVYYSTLQAAITATTNSVVHMFADTAEAITLKDGVDIEGNGYTLSEAGAGTLATVDTPAGAINVKISNLSIVNDNAGLTDAAGVILTNGTFQFNNVTISRADASVQALQVGLNAKVSGITTDGMTELIGEVSKSHLGASIHSAAVLGSATAVADDVKIVATGATIGTYGGIRIKNSSISSVDTAVYSDGAVVGDIFIDNCHILDTVNKIAVETDAGSPSNLTVINSYVEQNGTGTGIQHNANTDLLVEGVNVKSDAIGITIAGTGDNKIASSTINSAGISINDLTTGGSLEITDDVITSTGAAGASLKNATLTFEGNTIISKWNNAAGHAVTLNTGVAGAKFGGNIFKTVHASAYGINASAAATIIMPNGLFDSTLTLHASVTNLVENQTYLQKTVPAVQSVASSATVTPTFNNDEVIITAQAVALTLANPSGTAVQGQAMVIRIKDNATAQTIAYGANYRALGVTLPVTTVLSKTLYLTMIYNFTDTKWDVTNVIQEA